MRYNRGKILFGFHDRSLLFFPVGGDLRADARSATVRQANRICNTLKILFHVNPSRVVRPTFFAPCAGAWKRQK